MDDVKNQVEALLFSSGKFMNDENLSLIIGCDLKEVKKAMQQLKKEYDERDHSLMLVQEGNTWKINVREKYLELVRKIVADTELNKSVLKTLAVVAWKNPAKQSDIIKTRGNKAYEHIAQLEEMGFVMKEKDGRSFKVKVTEKFYEYFDVDNAKQLKNVFKDIKAPDTQTQLGDADEEDEEKETVEKRKTEEEKQQLHTPPEDAKEEETSEEREEKKEPVHLDDESDVAEIPAAEIDKAEQIDDEDVEEELHAMEQEAKVLEKITQKDKRVEKVEEEEIAEEEQIATALGLPITAIPDEPLQQEKKSFTPKKKTPQKEIKKPQQEHKKDEEKTPEKKQQQEPIKTPEKKQVKEQPKKPTPMKKPEKKVLPPKPLPKKPIPKPSPQKKNSKKPVPPPKKQKPSSKKPMKKKK